MKLLHWATSSEVRYALLGDIEEMYADIASAHGSVAANRWFWFQVVRSLPALLYDTIYWLLAMISNYALIALRNLRRKKSYAFINVTGLAVGIASCLLIALYIYDELSYDQYHEHKQRIARVTYDFTTPDIERALAMVGPPVGPDLQASFPEVEAAARFYSRSVLLSNQARPGVQYQEDNALYADASTFDVFSFKLYRGDPQTALAAPFSIVLTQSTAQRYFENEDPIGQVLLHDGEAYTVTGLMEDVPRNSHFSFDLLISFSTLEAQSPDFAQEFWALVVHTYILLSDEQDATALEAKLPTYLESQIGESMQLEGHSFRLGLEPLEDIYLYTTHHSSLSTTGNMASLYIFAGIALMILLIACVNFINLSTARALERAREVGVRKVIGAVRSQLATQFFGETLLMIGLASVIAFLLILASLKPFALLTGKSFTLAFLLNPLHLGFFLGLAIIIALFAGSYPALVLSRFLPITVLRGSFRTSQQGLLLRKGLVVFQFSLSIAFMIGTVIVFSQLDYMRNARLGYEKDELVTIAFHQDARVQQEAEIVKRMFLQRTDVTSVSVSGDIPGRGNLHSSINVEANNNEMRSVPWRFMALDYDFIDTYRIELAAGRSFSLAFPADSSQALLINEAAAADLGYQSSAGAIGATFQYGDREGVVVGVTRDFHLKSLQEAVEPIYMLIEPSRYRYFSIRLNTEDLTRTITELEAEWQALIPHRPFEYTFLNASLDRLYAEEEQFGQTVGLFALLAIFIACMGLLGLASLSTEQRTREIGLRKILGASPATIIWLLTGEFTRLVGIAFILIAPLMYFAAARWLAGFAYHIEIPWLVFVLSGSTALLLAWLTISFQAFRVASSNPLAALRVSS